MGSTPQTPLAKSLLRKLCGWAKSTRRRLPASPPSRLVPPRQPPSSAPPSPWAPTMTSQIETNGLLNPLGVAKILSAVVKKAAEEESRPDHPRQAGHRRRRLTGHLRFQAQLLGKVAKGEEF
ncbi:unnamed protein product [Tilletia caries]|uniref:Uncharacterized protein n=1 Tax=Tilletia caries TaxID=13290 RepID=A0ABN7J788_9BASI|nr:unnamed protein product [Tilletia caries]CAD6959793.1 unnamed protein product [Tilletia caries]CAD6975080.1 unnamed protein product [Tilletia controversa]